jgi:hypothetical protein
MIHIIYTIEEVKYKDAILYSGEEKTLFLDHPLLFI